MQANGTCDIGRESAEEDYCEEVAARADIENGATNSSNNEDDYNEQYGVSAAGTFDQELSDH